MRAREAGAHAIMSRTMDGFHHLRARMRAAREPFPATTPTKRRFDAVMYGVSIVQPAALLPQVLAVYVRHDIAGVSLATWLLLTFFNVMWAIYGTLHRDVPITVANVLLTIFDLAIVFGVLFY